MTPLHATEAALIFIGVTVLLRVLAIRFNWQTRAVRPWFTARGKDSTITEDVACEQKQEREREQDGGKE